MLERMMPHPPGTFPACNNCRREPKHFIATGRCGTDPIIVGTIGERHSLECGCRGAEQRTARHPRFADAQREWRDRFGVTALALRSRVRRAA